MALRVKNWDKWQSYRKDRGQPPWIKIHRRILRNPEWVSLSDAERGQLVSIWLLAADRDGELPGDAAIIQKLCFMNKAPNIKKFQELQFLENDGCQDDAKVTPTRRQHDSPKAETKAEAETEAETARARARPLTPPQEIEFVEYFTANGYDTDVALRAYRGYAAADWHDSRGNKIKSWKQKCQHVWFKPEHRAGSQRPQTPHDERKAIARKILEDDDANHAADQKRDRKAQRLLSAVK